MGLDSQLRCLVRSGHDRAAGAVAETAREDAPIRGCDTALEAYGALSPNSRLVMARIARWPWPVSHPTRSQATKADVGLRRKS